MGPGEPPKLQRSFHRGMWVVYLKGFNKKGAQCSVKPIGLSMQPYGAQDICDGLSVMAPNLKMTTELRSETLRKLMWMSRKVTRGFTHPFSRLIFVYIYTFIYTYIYIYIHICTYIYIFKYIYMYILYIIYNICIYLPLKPCSYWNQKYTVNLVLE